ncbi:MAG: hypothetical protein WAL52_21055 [Candidatus Sulfotelmatobacter sp.]
MNSAMNMRRLSVVEGGPLDRLQRRLGLMKLEAPLIVRRALVFSLVAWLPLLILSAVQGTLLTNVRIPFLYDPSADIRFLLSVPLLIVAEVVIGPRIVAATSHFITSGLIPEDRYQDFDAAVVDTIRLRDSTLAEATILAITYCGAFLSIRFLSATVSTWHSLVTESGHRFTLAGYWYALVSLPIYQFLVYRWLWRTFIWSRFLRRVSKLDLQLIPTHPDQAAGLGFLGETHRLYAIFIFAYTATASAIACREVLFDQVPIQSYKIPIAALIAIMLLLFLGPLFMFAPLLLRTRRKALHEYSALACKLGRLYDRKWVKGNPVGESLLSTPDNTSLANYSRDYELVDRMRVFPFEPRTALALALAGLIPMVPLLATVMPMEAIFKLLLKALG